MRTTLGAVALRGPVLAGVKASSCVTFAVHNVSGSSMVAAVVLENKGTNPTWPPCTCTCCGRRSRTRPTSIKLPHPGSADLRICGTHVTSSPLTSCTSTTRPRPQTWRADSVAASPPQRSWTPELCSGAERRRFMRRLPPIRPRHVRRTRQQTSLGRSVCCMTAPLAGGAMRTTSAIAETSQGYVVGAEDASCC